MFQPFQCLPPPSPYCWEALSRLPGLPGPKKLKRPNLAISSFKKGQILKNEKRPNFPQKIVKITKIKFRIS